MDILRQFRLNGPVRSHDIGLINRPVGKSITTPFRRHAMRGRKRVYRTRVTREF